MTITYDFPHNISILFRFKLCERSEDRAVLVCSGFGNSGAKTATKKLKVKTPQSSSESTIEINVSNAQERNTSFILFVCLIVCLIF